MQNAPFNTTPSYSLTKYSFTGQFSYMDDPTTGTTEGFGLMFYQSRFYDPSLGRFTQADSIVPNTIQGLDRYAYVNNSPINYIDPTGHLAEDKVKKLLGLEILTKEEFKKWLKANSALWNQMLDAEVGDMLVFMTETDGETVYQQYIIGEDKNGDYIFWGTHSTSEECETTCIQSTPNHANASQQEVLDHIQAGNEWGMYELDTNTTSYLKYSFKASSSNYVSYGDIVFHKSGFQQGDEFLNFSYQLDNNALGIGLISTVVGCLGGAYACIGTAIVSTFTVIDTLTISNATYINHSTLPYIHNICQNRWCTGD